MTQLQPNTDLDMAFQPGTSIQIFAILKNCAESMVKSMSLIFSKSFETGDLPSEWKTAHIVPIYKKGSKSDSANYRPVSLTSVACKLMESTRISSRNKFLVDNEMISSHQHDFVGGRSCLTNLLDTLEKWTKALDEGYGIDVLYLYYRKLSTVSHTEDC